MRIFLLVLISRRALANFRVSTPLSISLPPLSRKAHYWYSGLKSILLQNCAQQSSSHVNKVYIASLPMNITLGFVLFLVIGYLRFNNRRAIWYSLFKSQGITLIFNALVFARATFNHVNNMCIYRARANALKSVDGSIWAKRYIVPFFFE